MSSFLKWWLVAFLLSTALFASARSAEPPPPEGWMVYPTPGRGACEWLRANYSRQEWSVSRVNDRLVITPDVGDRRSTSKTPGVPKFEIPDASSGGGGLDSLSRPCRDCILRVDDGWLVGFDHGEWMGSLWWTDVTGRNSYQVADTGKNCDGKTTPPNTRFYEFDITNIVSLQKTGNRVLAFSGLQHGGLAFGEISSVAKRGGTWQTCRLKDLGGAPYVVLPEGAAWLVLSQVGLLRAHADGSVQSLGRFAFLEEPLFPNSMVQTADGTLYVGMRHFVARLLNEGGVYREQLLLPANQPPFVREPFIDGPGGRLPDGCVRLK